MRRLLWIWVVLLMTMLVMSLIHAQDDEIETIIHTVADGDTIDAIAIEYGVTRDDIMRLNGIDNPRLIFVGQQIIVQGPEPDTPTPTLESEVGDTGPVTSTPAPGLIVDESSVLVTPTITPTFAPAPVVSASEGAVLPANDPAVGNGVVCVMLFQDSNLNRIHENEETLLANGSITLQQGQTIISTHTTDGVTEPHCFEDISAGQYTVSVQPPIGFGLTTPGQLQLEIVTGAAVELLFGAAEGVDSVEVLPADDVAVVVQIADEPEKDSFVDRLIDSSGLIVFGLAGVVLLGGLGVSLIVRRR